VKKPVKKIFNYLANKLFFKDIQMADQTLTDRSLLITKAVCAAVIILVFMGGSLFTITHAMNYYEIYKTDFLARPERFEAFDVEAPSAVFFTKEEGDPFKIQGVLAYFEGYAEGNLSILIANIHSVPVEILSIQDQMGEHIYDLVGENLIEPADPIKYFVFEFVNVDEKLLENKAEILVNYAYDNGVVQHAFMSPFKRIDDDLFSGTAIRTINNMKDFDFIVEGDQFIFFEGKEIAIEKPLFIPKGKELLISPGQKIDLTNGAYIFSRTPVQFAGVEENPIRVYSSDGSGSGIFVTEAGGISNIFYTTFDGLNTPVSGVWSLTGAVTFYESNVNIDHSHFVNNVSEDGLNIIHSEFAITNSLFRDTISDAFDADFCTGGIGDSVFENTGNDAVDVSTTQLTIRNTSMFNIGDKGISAGEDSSVMIQDFHIDQTEIGIASKDLSVITGNDIFVSNAKIGITLYEKKPEFGPATIDISNFEFNGHIDQDYLIQKGSTLTIDGHIITPRSASKERLLFEKMIAGEPIQ
jgi:hypothetical protein